MDVERRQLGWAQRRVGAGAAGGARTTGCLFAVLFAPVAGCGGLLFGFGRSGGIADIGAAAVTLGPALFMLVGGALILRGIGATRRAAEIACAAVPPSVPGGAAGCHVCGADLVHVDLSRQAVVRCRYCAADNVVGREALARAAAVAAAATATLLAQVSAHAALLAGHRRRAAVLLAALVGLAPFAGCAAYLGATVVSPEGSARDEYVLARTKSGACVARFVTEDADGARRFSIGALSDGDRGGFWLDPSDLKGAKPFRARDLVGRTVRARGEQAAVERVYRRSFTGTERAVLTDGREASVDDLCLPVAPDDLPIVVPP